MTASLAPDLHTDEVLHALLRQDFHAFMQKCFHTVLPAERFEESPHLELLCDTLVRASRGELKRIIITVPPRSLKSLVTSVAFPAWLMGNDPSQRIIAASYSGDLAWKFSRDCRRVMESEWYARTFPGTTLARSTESELGTTGGGYRLATSVGATLTGKGGHMLIIDDPLKPEEALSDTSRKAVNEWFQTTAFSRLDSKKDGVIIVIQQRLHVEDLAGYLLEKGGWYHLNLPAVAETHERFELSSGGVFTRRPGQVLQPSREPPDTLCEIELMIGTFTFETQYQQNPVPAEGNLVKAAWFGRDRPPPVGPNTKFVQSWDTASKTSELSDYSVCLTFQIEGDTCYLVHVHRARLDYPSLKAKVREMAKAWRADHILVEDASSGIQLIQDLRQGPADERLHVIAVKPEGDKVMRMNSQSGHLEAGKVHLPSEASWLDTFFTEALAFPRGKHDDQVDALSQFLKWQFRMKSTVTVRTFGI